VCFAIYRGVEKLAFRQSHNISMRVKKILISGCSYTEHTPWPATVFESEKFQIKNVAASGFGNHYISNSITANLDYRPDFVFVLWSGINRIDLRVPNAGVIKDNNSGISDSTRGVANSRFYRSGGRVSWSGFMAGYRDIKPPDWPEIQNIQEWFDLPEDIKKQCIEHKINLSLHQNKLLPPFANNYFLMQYLEKDPAYLSELTFQNMTNCFLLLEKLGIPYRFSFIYDIFSRHEWYSLGTMVKEKYYNYIDWSRYIDLTPYEYGIRNDLLAVDAFHLANQGYEQWGQEIRKILTNQTELLTLFD